MLILAPPIDYFWCRISTIIEEIRQEGNYSWSVKDVYDALLNGQAYLYTSADKESFCIVKPKVDRFSGENVLFVWLASGVNGQREPNLEIIHELARGIGASKIEMESTRRGWERIGWTVKAVTYTMDVKEA